MAKGMVKELPARKSLSLGAEPAAPRGENCNIRDVLTASQDAQGTDFAAMVGTARDPGAKEKLESAVALLSRLNNAFGDDERAS